MRSVWVLLAPASVSMQAHYFDIVAGRDGSSVAFRTSFHLKGQTTLGGIYRWTKRGSFRVIDGRVRQSGDER